LLFLIYIGFQWERVWERGLIGGKRPKEGKVSQEGKVSDTFFRN